jgi:RNA polymerase-binding transcription factor DksA
LTATGTGSEPSAASARGRVNTNDATRELLIGTKAGVVNEVADLERSLASLRGIRAASSDDDEHDPEGPTLSSEWSHLRALLTSAEARLTEADAAIARLEAGRYGLCNYCGNPIAPARLEVRPTAALCVECASTAAG